MSNRAIDSLQGKDNTITHIVKNYMSTYLSQVQSFSSKLSPLFSEGYRCSTSLYLNFFQNSLPEKRIVFELKQSVSVFRITAQWTSSACCHLVLSIKIVSLHAPLSQTQYLSVVRDYLSTSQVLLFQTRPAIIAPLSRLW